MENLLARSEASQTRLNHRFTKFAHTFSNLTIEDLQLANVKRRLDQDLKLEQLLAVTACQKPIEFQYFDLFTVDRFSDLTSRTRVYKQRLLCQTFVQAHCGSFS